MPRPSVIYRGDSTRGRAQWERETRSYRDAERRRYRNSSFYREQQREKDKRKAEYKYYLMCLKSSKIDTQIFDEVIDDHPDIIKDLVDLQDIINSIFFSETLSLETRAIYSALLKNCVALAQHTFANHKKEMQALSTAIREVRKFIREPNALNQWNFQITLDHMQKDMRSAQKFGIFWTTLATFLIVGAIVSAIFASPLLGVCASTCFIGLGLYALTKAWSHKKTSSINKRKLAIFSPSLDAFTERFENNPVAEQSKLAICLSPTAKKKITEYGTKRSRYIEEATQHTKEDIGLPPELAALASSYVSHTPEKLEQIWDKMIPQLNELWDLNNNQPYCSSLLKNIKTIYENTKANFATCGSGKEDDYYFQAVSNIVDCIDSARQEAAKARPLESSFRFFLSSPANKFMGFCDKILIENLSSDLLDTIRSGNRFVFLHAARIGKKEL